MFSRRFRVKSKILVQLPVLDDHTILTPLLLDCFRGDYSCNKFYKFFVQYKIHKCINIHLASSSRLAKDFCEEDKLASPPVDSQNVTSSKRRKAPISQLDRLTIHHHLSCDASCDHFTCDRLRSLA